MLFRSLASQPQSLNSLALFSIKQRASLHKLTFSKKIHKNSVISSHPVHRTQEGLIIIPSTNVVCSDEVFPGILPFDYIFPILLLLFTFSLYMNLRHCFRSCALTKCQLNCFLHIGSCFFALNSQFNCCSGCIIL